MHRTALLSALLLATAAEPGAGGEDWGSHVEAAELLRLIDAGEAPTVVDVRSRGEFERGHVPGALHISFWAVLARASQVPTPPEQPIVVYCEHGPRAGLAKAGFRMSGFEKVVYLKGHMSGWKKAGLPQERASSAAD